MSEWQPIETAPKDGTAILAYIAERRAPAYVLRWEGYPGGVGDWTEASGEEYAIYSPTHWMPLPSPPA